MTTCAEGRHTAFVIMPYASAFDGLYEDFIRGVLTDVGFEVTRADEVTTSTGIMSTVISGIKESCVIVADLTDDNPNVYYEMGLAHALHKPVIYLAQNVDELPFDIKAYRVIHYTRDYAVMKTAEKNLSEVARGVFDGSTIFGNPFSDHEGVRITPTCPTGPVATNDEAEQQESDDNDVPAGILNYRVTVEEGMNDINKLTEMIGERTGQIGDDMASTTAKLTASLSDTGPSQARNQLAAVRLLAQELSSYARFLSGANDDYGETIERVRPALEGWLTAVEVQTDEDEATLRELLPTLDRVEAVTLEAKEVLDDFTSNLGELPNVERSFTRARNQVVDRMRRFIGNIEQLISMIARARELTQAKLDEQPSRS